MTAEISRAPCRVSGSLGKAGRHLTALVIAGPAGIAKSTILLAGVAEAQVRLSELFDGSARCVPGLPRREPMFTKVAAPAALRHGARADAGGQRVVESRRQEWRHATSLCAFTIPKAVEANLPRVYRMLGIRSRAELGCLVAKGHKQTKAPRTNIDEAVELVVATRPQQPGMPPVKGERPRCLCAHTAHSSGRSRFSYREDNSRRACYGKTTTS